MRVLALALAAASAAILLWAFLRLFSEDDSIGAPLLPDTEDMDDWVWHAVTGE